MTEWIINKIAAFLNNNEGCTLEVPEYNGNVVTLSITDSLGFVYELRLKPLGRKYDPSHNNNSSSYLRTPISLYNKEII